MPHTVLGTLQTLKFHNKLFGYISTNPLPYYSSENNLRVSNTVR